MYGLEKNRKSLFKFDLEKQLTEDPSQVQTILKATEGKIQEIKNQLRLGVSGNMLDQLGVLLHGYTALQKLLNKFLNKK